MRYEEVWLGIKGFTAVGVNKAKDTLRFIVSDKKYITYHQDHKNYSPNIDKLQF